MSHTYSDVDASPDPLGAASWQERMSAWPQVRAYKDRTHALLADLSPVIDIGSGPGMDAASLGTDRCVGLEPSATMSSAASARGVVVCRGDAHHLPFRDGGFAGARADRVFQHLADPAGALREMVRVVARDGRVVVVDPDQATLAVEVPGVRRNVLDRLVGLRREIGYRNGTLISRIPQMLQELRVTDVIVEAFPLTLTDPADAFGLPSWPTVWREEGGFTDEELEEWHRALRMEPVTGFMYTLSFVVVTGIVSTGP